MHGLDKLLQVIQRSKGRLYIDVITDIIAVVNLWRWIHWVQPENLHAKVFEVPQALFDTCQFFFFGNIL